MSRLKSHNKYVVFVVGQASSWVVCCLGQYKRRVARLSSRRREIAFSRLRADDLDSIFYWMTLKEYGMSLFIKIINTLLPRPIIIGKRGGYD